MHIYIFGMISTILYVVLCIMFIETFERKRTDISNFTRCFSYLVFIFITYFISAIFIDNLYLKAIGIILIGSLFLWICYQQKYVKILVLIILYHGLCFATDYFSVIIVQKCFNGMTLEKIYTPVVSLLIGVFSQLIVFLIIMVLKRAFYSRNTEVLTELEWIRFSIFPIFTLIVVVAILSNFETITNYNQKNILISIAFGMLIMNVMSFSLINDILKREMQLREANLFRERVKNETNMYHSISEGYDKQRKREHEFKNQMSAISAMVANRDFDGLIRYFKSYDNEVLHNMDLIDTNHCIVNAILNVKYKEAVEKGILFVFKINDLSGIKIADEDIIIILSNLLNNAIEASEKCDKKVVKIKFVRNSSNIVIVVANNFAKRPMMAGDRYITSKSDKNMHGIGIENVKETVEKYGGFYNIITEGNVFKFIICITM